MFADGNPRQKNLEENLEKKSDDHEEEEKYEKNSKKAPVLDAVLRRRQPRPAVDAHLGADSQEVREKLQEDPSHATETFCQRGLRELPP